MIKKLQKKILLETGYLAGTSFMAPEFLSLLLTYRCNFQCQTCNIWKTPLTELSEAQWFTLAEKIKVFFPTETFIELNGGEPLLRFDLVSSLIRALKPKFSRVGLNTNGYLLEAEKVARLKQAGIDFVKISLYSQDKAIHDAIRGVAGAQERAMQAIELLLAHQIQTEVGILLTGQNIDGVYALIEQLRAMSSQLSIILQPLDEVIEATDRSTVMDTPLWPTNEQVKNLFTQIKMNPAQIKNSAQNLALMEHYYLQPASVLKNRCFAGQRSFIIYPDGQVALCFKGQKIGNAVAEQFPKIWNKQALQERKRIKACKNYCRIVGCNYARGIKELLSLT